MPKQKKPECIIHKIPLDGKNMCPECTKTAQRGQIIWITGHGVTAQEVESLKAFLVKFLPANFPFKIIFAPDNFELIDRKQLEFILENLLRFVRSEQNAQKFTA